MQEFVDQMLEFVSYYLWWFWSFWNWKMKHFFHQTLQHTVVKKFQHIIFIFFEKIKLNNWLAEDNPSLIAFENSTDGCRFRPATEDSAAGQPIAYPIKKDKGKNFWKKIRCFHDGLSCICLKALIRGFAQPWEMFSELSGFVTSALILMQKFSVRGLMVLSIYIKALEYPAIWWLWKPVRHMAEPIGCL